MRALNIISFHLLITLVSSLHLKCELNYDVCYVKQLNCTSSGKIVKSVNEVNTVLANITVFHVQDQTCHYIPQKIADFLPNLKTINVIDSGLKTISQSDLAPFPKLTRIHLAGNQLEYIDGDLFSRNTEIRYVTLEDTKLNIINGPILASLKKLNYIRINLTCFEDECGLSNCIPKITKLFTENCEFDSKYPGVRKYFQELKNSAESCKKF